MKFDSNLYHEYFPVLNICISYHSRICWYFRLIWITFNINILANKFISKQNKAFYWCRYKLSPKIFINKNIKDSKETQSGKKGRCRWYYKFARTLLFALITMKKILEQSIKKLCRSSYLTISNIKSGNAARV